jgi:hypothetical protein
MIDLGVDFSSIPCDPHQQRREYRRAEDDPESCFREIAARRLFGKLARDEFEIAFDQGKVGSRLIGLPQRDGVFVWHAHVMTEASCSIVMIDRGAHALPLFDEFRARFCLASGVINDQI